MTITDEKSKFELLPVDGNWFHQYPAERSLV